MQSVPVVSLNPTHGELCLIQHYMIKFISNLQQVVVFSWYSGFLHQWNWPPRYNRNIVESGMKPDECYALRHRDKSAPGHFGTCVKHFGTKTNRHPDNSTPQLDKSSPQKDKSALVFFKSSLGSGIILESFQPEFFKPPFVQVFSSWFSMVNLLVSLL